MEHTFTFVDLAGFSALTQTHGDETAADLVERFTALVDGALMRDAERVATVGDAVFLVSAAPEPALRAVDRVWRRAESERDFPVLRAGMHHGEAARRGRQFYGTAVNVAARVAARASGGQVLVTAPVAATARAMNLAVRALGPAVLKNLRQPFELFSVTFQPHGVEYVDPVCRMRVTPDTAGAHLEVEGTEYWFCSRDCLRVFVGERVPLP
jgi:class 3 adenylate cyclase